VFIRLDGLWRARGPLPKIPLRNTNTAPPPSHPRGKQDGFTAPVAGHLSTLPSTRRNWQTRDVQLASGTREVSHGRKDTEILCLECQRFSPLTSSRLLLPASQKHRTRLTQGKSATARLCNPSEEALHELTASSALENPRCTTDLTASASQDHLPGITLDTHRCSSLSPTSRGRLTSNHHRPKVDSIPDPHLILTTPASWDCHVRITPRTTSPQVGPPTLPKERKQTTLWQQSTLATPCSCSCGFERTLHQNHSHAEQQDTEDVRNSRYAC